MTLIESMPVLPDEIGGLIDLQTRLREAIPPAAASLAQRGYLGCVPLAHQGGDEVVLQLRPRQPLACIRPALARWEGAEAMTIAPDLRRLLGGRLAQRDFATFHDTMRPEQEARLLEVAESFGDVAGTQRVIRAARKVDSENPQERCAAMWRALDPGELWCEIVSTLWSNNGEALDRWLENAIVAHPDEPIVRRVYVVQHTRRHTDVDIASVAWQVLETEAIVDAMYGGIIRGPAPGAWEKSALYYATEWLEHRWTQMTPMQRQLWNASKVFAEAPSVYDGREHLEVARALRNTDAEIAYAQALNAAAFAARNAATTPFDAIAVASEIAAEQEWSDIRSVLEWTIAELSGIPVSI